LYALRSSAQLKALRIAALARKRPFLSFSRIMLEQTLGFAQNRVRLTPKRFATL